jgi:hypothetical protein
MSQRGVRRTNRRLFCRCVPIWEAAETDAQQSGDWEKKKAQRAPRPFNFSVSLCLCVSVVKAGVPHPFAFFAKRWDSTDASRVEFALASSAVVIPPAKSESPESHSGLQWVPKRCLPSTFYVRADRNIVKPVSILSSDARRARGLNPSGCKSHSTAWQAASSTHWKYPLKSSLAAQ